MRVLTGTRSMRAILLGALMAAIITSPALAGTHQGDALGGGATLAAANSSGVVPNAVSRRPDARVRLQKYQSDFGSTVYNKPWKGNNIYNTTATKQTVKTTWYSTTPGTVTYTYGISIQNDGRARDRFKVRATGSAVSGWIIRYYRGTTNITSAVVAGTYQSSSLAPSGTYVITAKVTTASGNNYPQDGVARLVTATSVADATKKDAVKFVLKEWACGC